MKLPDNTKYKIHELRMKGDKIQVGAEWVEILNYIYKGDRVWAYEFKYQGRIYWMETGLFEMRITNTSK